MILHNFAVLGEWTEGLICAHGNAESNCGGITNPKTPKYITHHCASVWPNFHMLLPPHCRSSLDNLNSNGVSLSDAG